VSNNPKDSYVLSTQIRPKVKKVVYENNEKVRKKKKWDELVPL